MSDLVTAPRAELIGLIYELIDKVQVLEAENAHLREQLHSKGKGKDSSTQITPDFVKANVKRKRVKERKKRENSYHRVKDEPTEQIFHSPDNCPDCGGKLGKPTVAYTRQVLDLPITSYQVIEHVVFKRWCFRCQKRVYPGVDLSKYCLGQGRIGLNLASTITLLRDRMRLPFKIIQTYLKLFFSLTLSEGEIIGICHTVASLAKPAYDNLLDDIRSSPVVYADETGGRESGRNGYFWSFSTDKVHLVLYRKSRAAKVVEEIVGKDSEHYQGVIVSDFYSSYNTYLGDHQRCWVHLFRDIDELKKKYSKHPPLNKWAKQVSDIYYEAINYHPPPNLKIGEEAQIRLNKQRECEQKLLKICQSYLTRETPMSTLCGRIYTFLPELFTFVKIPKVSPNNNNAERIIRHLVIARKISGGTRSEKGSTTKTILTSIFDSWRLQGLNPFTQCRTLLATCQ